MTEKTRILFVPFAGANAEHFLGRSKLMKEGYDRLGKEGRYMRIVRYTGNENPFLKYMRSADDAIYVRGHGSAGRPSIRSHPGGVLVPIETVCDRLIASGLKTPFAGRIKFYS